MSDGEDLALDDIIQKEKQNKPQKVVNLVQKFVRKAINKNGGNKQYNQNQGYNQGGNRYNKNNYNNGNNFRNKDRQGGDNRPFRSGSGDFQEKNYNGRDSRQDDYRSQQGGARKLTIKKPYQTILTIKYFDIQTSIDEILMFAKQSGDVKKLKAETCLDKHGTLKVIAHIEFDTEDSAQKFKLDYNEAELDGNTLNITYYDQQ